MSDITISIIIPVYNTASDKLNRCIESVLNQTFLPYEAILIDDGSSEEYAKYCDDVAAKSDLIKVIHKKNEGSAVARNTGLDLAKGEYIMFVDSDDMIPSHVMMDCKNALLKYDRPDVVLGLVKKRIESELVAVKDEREFELKESGYIEDEKEKICLVNHILGYEYKRYDYEQGYLGDCPYARVVKKSVAPHFSPESMWNDDTVWNLYLFSNCKSIVFIDSIWYEYLINAESKTRKYRKNCANEFRYRTDQEMNLVKQLLPDCYKGISIRIWRDTIILGRTYLYHKSNSMPIKGRYAEYKQLIGIDSYKYMLKNIDFNYETAKGNRFAKEILRMCLRYRLDIISFMLWKKICREIG